MFKQRFRLHIEKYYCYISLDVSGIKYFAEITFFIFPFFRIEQTTKKRKPFTLLDHKFSIKFTFLNFYY